MKIQKKLISIFVISILSIVSFGIISAESTSLLPVVFPFVDPASTGIDVDGRGWNNGDVIVSWLTVIFEDGLPKVVNIPECGTTTVSENTDKFGTTLFCSLSNEFGTATQSVTIRIDKIHPKIVINTPLNDSRFVLNQRVLADWSVIDTLSGIESVIATASSTNPIDTSSFGEKTFRITARDVAGNVTTTIVTYEVVPYVFRGFKSPLEANKDFNRNRTIPVKFELYDAQGNSISNAVATLTVNGVPAVSEGGSNIGNYFRYDLDENQYIFNLSTRPLSLGVNILTVTLDDGTKHSISIIIR